MPQQSDIGILLSALGRGVSGFAGAERLSREEKARRDAERINRNMAIAEVRLKEFQGARDFLDKRAGRAFETSERLGEQRFDVSEREAEDATALDILLREQKFKAGESALKRESEERISAATKKAKDAGTDPTIAINRELDRISKEKKLIDSFIGEKETAELKRIIPFLGEGGVPELDLEAKNFGIQLRNIARGIGPKQKKSRFGADFLAKDVGTNEEEVLEAARNFQFWESRSPQVKDSARAVLGIPVKAKSKVVPKSKDKPTNVQGKSIPEVAKFIAGIVKGRSGQTSVREMAKLNPKRTPEEMAEIVEIVDLLIGNKKWRKE